LLHPISSTLPLPTSNVVGGGGGGGGGDDEVVH